MVFFFMIYFPTCWKVGLASGAVAGSWKQPSTWSVISPGAVDKVTGLLDGDASGAVGRLHQQVAVFHRDRVEGERSACGNRPPKVSPKPVAPSLT